MKKNALERTKSGPIMAEQKENQISIREHSMFSNSINRFKYLYLLIFIILLSPTESFSQFDEYAWTPKSLAASTYQIAAGCGIATDQFDRIYYVDNITQKIFQHDPVNGWYAPLNLASTSARLGTNLIFKDNAVYYIGTNHLVCKIELGSNNSWVPSVISGYTIGLNTKIEVVSENQIFYVRASDNKVCYYWQSGGSSGYAPIPGSYRASSYTNLQFVNNHLFYIGLGVGLGVTETLRDCFWNGNNWVHQTRPAGDIDPKSKVCARDENQVYYASLVDSRIMTSWTNSMSSGYNILNDLVEPIKVSASMHYENNQIYYIDKKNQPHVAFWDDCKWWDQTLNEEVSASIFNPSFHVKDGGFYYVNPSGSTSLIEQQDYLNGFVYKKGDDLMLNGDVYRPLGMCYMVHVVTPDNGSIMHPIPHTNYSYGPVSEYSFECDVMNPSNYCLDEIKANIDDIASRGFNSIRFNDLTVRQGKDPYEKPVGSGNWITEDKTKLYFDMFSNSGGFQAITEIVTPAIQAELFDLMEVLIDYCGDKDLKVNHFVGLEGVDRHKEGHPAYIEYLRDMADHFKNNPNIYCYSYLLEADLEAYVIGHIYDEKDYICAFTSDCYDAIRSVDKNHLITAGVANNELSVYSWGLGVMKTDFLTMHKYPIKNEDDYSNVKRSLKWDQIVARQLKKPWIIGETNLLGTDEKYPSTWTAVRSEQEQLDYADFMLEYTYESGAAGVQWWQYSDVDWGPSNASQMHYGFNYWDGSQIVPKKILTSGIFNTFSPTQSCALVPTPTDYYFIPVNNPVHHITGIVSGAWGEPIEGAIVMAEPGSSTGQKFFGITDANGAYTVETDHHITSLSCSAVGKNVFNYNQTPALVGEVDFIESLWNVDCSYPTGKNRTGEADGSTEEIEYSDLNPSTSLKVFPSPVDDLLNVSVHELNAGQVTISIYAMSGALMSQTSFESMNGANKFTLPTSSLVSGMYLIELNQADHKYVDRFIKK